MARNKRRNRPIVIVSYNINGDNSPNVVQSVNGVNTDIIDKLLVLLEEKDKQIDRLTKLLEQYNNKAIGGQNNGE